VCLKIALQIETKGIKIRTARLPAVALEAALR